MESKSVKIEFTLNEECLINETQKMKDKFLALRDLSSETEEEFYFFRRIENRLNKKQRNVIFPFVIKQHISA